METNYWVILNIVSLCILAVCLYIIKDAVKNIKRRVTDKSSPALLYLREKSLIRGIEILMVAMVIWSMREGMSLIGSVVDYDLGLVNAVFSIFVAVFLSYGLYILVVTFRTGFEEEAK